MIKGFRIDRNDGRIYAMGATAVSGGVHFSFAPRGRPVPLFFIGKGPEAPREESGFLQMPEQEMSGA